MVRTGRCVSWTEVAIAWREKRHRVGRGRRIFTSQAAASVSFKHFSADVEGNVAEGHEKIARCCEENRLKELSLDGMMRNWELASPWPSRRGWLPEAAAWIRLGSDESANAGGPTKIVG